jgi:trans-2,3-dihydro-3-hydroxyanthranilate isomerase
VFAHKKFAGNQALVVVYENPLTTDQMLEISQELNFKETTFLASEPNPQGYYNLRIFAMKKEIGISGHPILATAYIVNQFLKLTQEDQIKLHLDSGDVIIDSKNLLSESRSTSISKQQPTLFSNQGLPKFGKEFDRVLLSRILNLDVIDIDERFPIQEVFIGVGFIIIPIKDLSAMKRITINQQRSQWLIQKTKAKLLLAFCPEVEDPQNQFHVRVFADYYDIHEDSASGSGSGCLAAYCSKYNYFGSDKVDIKIEQGIELGRPSQICATATPSGDRLDVQIGGQIILIGKGELYL